MNPGTMLEAPAIPRCAAHPRLPHAVADPPHQLRHVCAGMTPTRAR
jgi:hypothetical protein